MKTLTQRLEPYNIIDKERKEVLLSIQDENGNTDFRVVIPIKSKEEIERAIKGLLKGVFIDEVFDQLVSDGFIKDSNIETWGVYI